MQYMYNVYRLCQYVSADCVLALQTLELLEDPSLRLCCFPSCRHTAEEHSRGCLTSGLDTACQPLPTHTLVCLTVVRLMSADSS